MEIRASGEVTNTSVCKTDIRGFESRLALKIKMGV